MAKKKTYGYGKRPLWQWVLIYLVIGGILYFVIYYIFFANKKGYAVPATTGKESTTESPYNYNQ